MSILASRSVRFGLTHTASQGAGVLDSGCDHVRAEGSPQRLLGVSTLRTERQSREVLFVTEARQDVVFALMCQHVNGPL